MSRGLLAPGVVAVLGAAVAPASAADGVTRRDMQGGLS
jgi:hypothetical protein